MPGKQGTSPGCQLRKQPIKLLPPLVDQALPRVQNCPAMPPLKSINKDMTPKYVTERRENQLLLHNRGPFANSLNWAEKKTKK